ncbi:hypothetical protein BJV82DRAFT_606221 [Fennellomyces sp. T-0311]|nr:hypothetical protein BJV82DRAFT_606221 [Fennellomyces sp. T-0311]
MYHARYPPQQQHHYHPDMTLGPSAPHVPTLTDDWMKRSSGLVSQYHRYHLPPPEPTPFDTDRPSMPQLQGTQLADFASAVAYLMWRARRPSIMLIHRATAMPNDNIGSNQSYIPVHEDLAAWNENASSANVGFRKYCRQLLDATRLSESVVLLALKFIAKLLQRHPRIHGAEGSEYRLFTVALMLGNKYLDDNTFTNTTWSHVSGMSKAELQTMEFEFLDVVDYRLCVNKYEYYAWKEELVAFHDKIKAMCQTQSWEHMIQLTTTTTIECSSHISLPKMAVTPPYSNDYSMPLLYREGTPHFPHEISNKLLTRVPLRASFRSSPRQSLSQSSPRFSYTHAPPPQKSQISAKLPCIQPSQQQPIASGYSHAASPCFDQYRQYYPDSTGRTLGGPRQQFIDRSMSTPNVQVSKYATTTHDQETWRSLQTLPANKSYSLATAHNSMETFSSASQYSNSYRLPPLSATSDSLFFTTTTQLPSCSKYIPPISNDTEQCEWLARQRIPVELSSDSTTRITPHSVSLTCYRFLPTNDGGAPLRQLYNTPDIFHMQR